MLFSNTGDLNLQPFNPNHAPADWSGVFKGMVFAILAFIGFEAAAPLGEEAKNPRRTVPRAVVGSAIAIGIFYVLCSYAWVFGAGFNNFVNQATTAPTRGGTSRKVFWGTRLGARVPRDLQLDRGELERGGQRGDARLLLAGAQRPRAAAARADAPALQDAERRDHLDDASSRSCSSLAVRLEVGPADRLRR